MNSTPIYGFQLNGESHLIINHYHINNNKSTEITTPISIKFKFKLNCFLLYFNYHVSCDLRKDQKIIFIQRNK